jgi:hypothetical protein
MKHLNVDRQPRGDGNANSKTVRKTDSPAAVPQRNAAFGPANYSYKILFCNILALSIKLGSLGNGKT